MIIAPIINERKMFKLWTQALEENGLDKAIAASFDDAISAYKANPKKRTLKYIRKLNPQAADHIQSVIDSQKQK